MASETLGWEWPAGRAADATIRGKILDIRPEPKRWFGIANSPSMTSSLPEPVLVRFSTISSKGKSVHLSSDTIRMPKIELNEIVVGNTVDVSVLESGAVIGIVRVSEP